MYITYHQKLTDRLPPLQLQCLITLASEASIEVLKYLPVNTVGVSCNCNKFQELITPKKTLLHIQRRNS